MAVASQQNIRSQQSRKQSHPYDRTSFSIPKNSACQVDCRGLLLLGYKASNGVVFCCVHQLAVELWKAFDTPRVSVQKKIGDLSIAIHHCDKAQVRMLRDAGIIHNFRATMIKYHDALRLYDALEYSRKKRGLEKHALKAKLTPGQRAQRPEERRARRLTTSTNRTFLHNQNGNSSVPPIGSSVYDNVVAHVSPNHKHQEQEDSECSLIRISSLDDSVGTYDATDAVLSLDTLLTASPPEKAGGEDCMVHQIQLIPFNIAEIITTQPRTVLGQRSISFQHMDPDVQRFNARGKTSIAHRQRSNVLTDIPDVVICEPPTNGTTLYDSSTASSSKKQANLPASRLSSPILDSSECEEYSSTYSQCSSRRLSSTPERFLRFDGSSEEEVESSSESEPEVFDEEYIPPKSVLASSFLVHHTPTVSSITATKKIFGTKLRHFAHASSPNITASFSLGKRLPQDSSSDLTSPSAPLVISVPISMLRMTARQRSSTFMSSTKNSKRGRPPKNKNRQTALSSFVTKKRASSLASSTSSERSVDPLTTAKKPKMGAEESTSNKATTGSQTQSKKKSKGVSTVSTPRPSSLNGKTVAQVIGTSYSQSGNNSVSLVTTGEHDLERKMEHGLKHLTESTQLQTSITGLPLSTISRMTASREMGGVSGLNGNFPHQNFEDDQLSVASSSTHSAQSKGSGCVLSAISGRGSTKSNSSSSSSDPNGLKSTIKFEEMFSYFPPKLVIRNGELQPERTLSVKNLDRQGIANLPRSHPFLSWTLGQPTRTTTKCPRKRKAGSSKPLCSSTVG